ncbi:DNA repair protein [Muricauda sp. JGD-17]|uniref:DNA repair protein n=1 Tax=Flagellimonas ochracea TaxID=2696472 RepID=A0A964WYE3_9FLAO|nr:JAB domain-containing protein [Allomuricauda ochracea]NAY93085.1 DNA repair protein [Allomuricauda ochracea]
MEHKVNEILISYREKLSTLKSLSLQNSNEVAQLLFKNWDTDTIGLHETFKVLLLNQSNKVKGIYPLSTGGISGTLVDVRILFAIVLKTLSTGIILTHNHPSGQLRASGPDRLITEKIQEGAKVFDVQVLDHIILAPDGRYYSFADCTSSNESELVQSKVKS